MWEPRCLTTLWAFTAWYRDSFTLPCNMYHFTVDHKCTPVVDGVLYCIIYIYIYLYLYIAYGTGGSVAPGRVSHAGRVELEDQERKAWSSILWVECRASNPTPKIFLNILEDFSDCSRTEKPEWRLKSQDLDQCWAIVKEAKFDHGLWHQQVLTQHRG
jgi:hypothetical protein